MTPISAPCEDLPFAARSALAMRSTLAGAIGGQNGYRHAEDPAVGDGGVLGCPGLVRPGQAADDELVELDEEEDVEDADAAGLESELDDVDGLAAEEAGELLDEAPRLSLR
ncbi:hypothetical protein GCM10010394_34190 [Streptomyces crystallinus]|uniref:Uncharacterized protein n=1 Tax=Streptomyces crystallinus TaxID=68191 RepID=A0ABP3R1F4_9ACTN